MVSGATGGAYLGQYSGITMQTIDNLIQADSTPMYLMQNQITSLQSKENAWGDVRSRLNNLLNKLNVLQKPETYNSKISNSTNTNVVTISGDSSSIEANHDIVVSQLATNTKLMGTRVDTKSTKDALNLSGTLNLSLTYHHSIDKDGKEITITNQPENNSTDSKSQLKLDINETDSLSSIVTKINQSSKTTNIEASIVDNHLVLKSSLAGNYTINTTSDKDEVTSKLGLNNSDVITTSGKPSLFSIDGLNTAKNSNSITDVIEGTTVNLVGVSPLDNDKNPQSTNFSLKNDNSKFQSAVNDFVSQYNSLMGLVSDDLSIGDPSKSDNKVGVLSGDRDLISLQTRLRSLVTSNNVSGNSKTKDDRTLSANEIGISFTDKEGTLGFDSTKFKNALENDASAVQDFFYKADVSKTGIASNESGYTFDLSKFANSYLINSTGNQGIIATKNATFDSTIKDLNKQIDNFQDRLSAKREQYVAQFTALDSFMMQAQSQLNYFAKQSGVNNNNN